MPARTKQTNLFESIVEAVKKTVGLDAKKATRATTKTTKKKTTTQKSTGRKRS